ncbi:multidrug efflux pump acrAB operon transcription repressor [Klebsiella pneumoniae subsp. ozaenae]|uniref:Multidrug efflux pump acrAB operon transcription repressor n=1 Tax=Klebsiella pneumoniae subsp. ozaenae TaxID=574 RepID=A0A377Z3V9_KLEPO|nr:multidrug efflux pump acrAB operon transcription repressor [Klebsiella pneumoniae subsp. ozaenae]
MKECIAAKLLPANLLTRRAAVLMRSYLSGLMENWLFAPDSFDLHAESAGLRRYSAGDVSILPDATRPGELVSLKVARGWA